MYLVPFVDTIFLYTDHRVNLIALPFIRVPRVRYGNGKSGGSSPYPHLARRIRFKKIKHSYAGEQNAVGWLFYSTHFVGKYVCKYYNTFFVCLLKLQFLTFGQNSFFVLFNFSQISRSASVSSKWTTLYGVRAVSYNTLRAFFFLNFSNNLKRLIKARLFTENIRKMYKITEILLGINLGRLREQWRVYVIEAIWENYWPTGFRTLPIILIHSYCFFIISTVQQSNFVTYHNFYY